ncbi:helix-turn-helix domain-containing protein [Methylibium sp.]|uniref:helix-turn-helix domain-containing protein n=1 Tax=Methylibium sp. TaxID=2067992 RepID=UPI003D1521AB
MALLDWMDGPETTRNWIPELLEVDRQSPLGMSGGLGALGLPRPEARRASPSAIGMPLGIHVGLPQGLPPAATHPLHLIDRLVEKALRDAGDWQGAFHDQVDDRSIRPARLIRAVLLQGLYSLRCDHQLTEQLTYNLLYRWFVGLNIDDPIWDAAAFAQARKALQGSAAGGAAFRSVLKQVRAVALLWSVHFNVDEGFFGVWLGPISPPVRKDLPPIIAEQTEALSAAGISVMRGSRNNRLDKALAVILRRIGDSTLTPDAIASEVCVSRRALYSLFKEQGLTPTKAVRDIRLEHSKRVLCDPGQQFRKITDVALDFGFGDVATFCRQFKHRYGLSPRDFRATASRLQGGG